MSIIDQRIVEMSFDNKQFEKDISKTKKSLTDFEKQLQFDGATAGVDKLTASFTKMGVVSMSIIQNLTNRVVDFSIKVAKSLTLDPLNAGMADYETKLTTMQTITNATGKSIQEVEEYFSDLDTYADKTIYNLTDMTSSMAKFVNAGVSLEKAVPAIKGVANMTALAGQNANAASIAMYNIAQSIAGGFLTTLDYKSLNLANVATVEWKQQMIEAAVAMGTLTKAANGYKVAGGGAYSGMQLFTEGLKDQWATTEVLLKVLGDYGDETTDIGKKAQAAAQDVKSFAMLVDTLTEAVGTGWTRSFELIIGDLKESKQLWTGISEAVGGFLDILAEGRNTMLEFWHDNGGREAFLNSLKYIAIAIIKLLLTISIAMDSIFPPKTQQQFVDMFKAFEAFTKTLIMSDETADKLQRTFRGLFAVIDIILQVLGFFGGILGQIIKQFFPGFSGGILEITANIGDFLVILRDIITYSGTFQKALEVTGGFIAMFHKYAVLATYSLIGLISGLADGSITIGDVGRSIANFLGGVKDFISLLLQGYGVSESFVAAFNDMNNEFSEGTTSANGFSKGLGLVVSNITNFVSSVSSKLLPALGWIANGLKNLTWEQVGIIAIGIGLIALSKTLLKAILPISGVLDSFSEVLINTSKVIKNFSLSIKAQALFTIAKGIALLVASLIALSFVPTEKIAVSLAALTLIMTELLITMALLSKIKNPAKIGIELTALSAGLFVIAKAASQFEKMSWEGILKASVAIGAFLTMIWGFMTVLGNGKKMATGLTSFSVGIIALSGALFVLSKVNFDTLSQGSLTLLGILTVLALYTKMVNGRDFAKSSSGMVGFSIGIMALTGALMLLGNLQFSTLLQGSIALLTLLTTIGLYTKLVNGQDLKKTTKGLVGFGVGLLAMTASLTLLGKLPFDVLTKGSIALLGLLTTLGLFVNMTNGKDLSVTAGSLIGLGIGLMALTGALAILGNLNFGTIAQGTATIVVLMAAIAAFIKFTNGSDLGVTAGGIIAFATGIGILAGVMALLTLLDTNKLMAASIAIGGIITVIGLFSKLTSIGALAASAGGLVIFALALAGLSIPIKMIAEIPWQQLAATAGVIVAAIGMFAVVAALMPVFAGVSAVIGPALLGVLGIGAVIAEIGILITAFGALSKIPGVTNLIDSGGELLQQIGYAIGSFVGGIIGGIGAGATSGLPAIADNISAFGYGLQPFFESVKNVDTKGVQSVKYLAEALLILGGASVVDSLTSWLTGGNSLTTFAAELKAFAPDFVSFANTLTQGNVNADLVQKTANAAKAMAELATELPNQGDSVAKWFVGDNTLSVFAEELRLFAPDFVAFANTLAKGNIDTSIVEKTANAAKAMSELATQLPNQGNSVVKWFVGDNTLSVFASELKSFAPDFVSFANTLTRGNIDADTVEKTANAAKAMAELASELPNQGNSVVKWFVGDNTLSVFAEELRAFAPDFVSFANTISSGNINASIVEKTANAAKAMSELASGLPNQGGMVAWFTGDNSLSKFAEELVKFAPKFVTFANSFGSVRAETVTPGIEALNSLVNMLNISGKDAIGNLAKGFENNKSSTLNKIKKVLDDVVKSIDKYDNKMVDAGENIVKGLIKGMRNKESDVAKATKEILADNIKETLASNMDMHSPSRDMAKDGKNIVQGLIDGISSKKNALTNSVKDMVGTTKETINSSSFTQGLQGLLDDLVNSFGATGEDSGSTFANALNGIDLGGFTGKINKTTKKVKTAFEKFKEWIENEKFFERIDTAGEIAEWEKQQKLYKKGTDERKEIDRQLFTLRRRLVDEGYQNEMDKLENLKFYGKLSTQEEITKLEELRKQYKKGSKYREEIDKQLYTLRNQLIDETYQSEIDKIDKLNAYGQLSLTEELAQYRALQKEYKKGSEEREKIDLQIFNLEKKIYETRKKYIEDVKATQAKADEDRLAAQLAYNKAVKDAQDEAAKAEAKAQKKYDETMDKANADADKKRLDARKKYDDAIVKAIEKEANTRIKLEQELADDLLSIHEKLIKDVEAADQKYADALKSRADTIYGYYGIFDEVSERTVTTPEEILKNINDQNAAIEDWRYSLQQLAARGISDEMLKELEQLGVSSSGQLSAMLAMTDEQLAEFSALFNRKHELANTQALSELQEYRKEVDKEIADLYAQADADIDARISKFNESIGESNLVLQTELNEAQTILNEALTEINNNLQEKQNEAQLSLTETLNEINATLQEKLDSAKQTLNDTLDDINKNTVEKLATLKETFDTTMETIHDKTTAEYKAMNKDLKKQLTTLNTETTKQMEDMSKTVDKESTKASEDLSKNVKEGTTKSETTLKDFNNSVESSFNTFTQTLYNIGYNGAQGLANGLRSGQYLVSSAGSAIAQAALSAAMATLQVKSPSRAMEEVGMFADKGLVNGLLKNINLVKDAAKTVAMTTLETIGNSLNDMASIAMMEVDLSPTITPVLNLDHVRQDVSTLSSLLNNGSSYDLATRSVGRIGQDQVIQNGSGNSEHIEINNIYNIPNLSVRRDDDVGMVAEQLYNRQVTTLRGLGQRPRLGRA